MSLRSFDPSLPKPDGAATVGLPDFSRNGTANFETMNVPRALIWCIRSKRFMSVACESVSEMALALLTTMSIPPKVAAVLSSASRAYPSSRTSTVRGSALPPAFSISSAAE
jgi:hypothetical protein